MGECLVLSLLVGSLVCMLLGTVLTSSWPAIGSCTTRKATDAEHLLEVVNNIRPAARVILDVGAQILELNLVTVISSSSPQVMQLLKKVADHLFLLFFRDCEFDMPLLEILVGGEFGQIGEVHLCASARDSIEEPSILARVFIPFQPVLQPIDPHCRSPLAARPPLPADPLLFLMCHHKRRSVNASSPPFGYGSGSKKP
jgi:hypothetical protein